MCIDPVWEEKNSICPPCKSWFRPFFTTIVYIGFLEHDYRRSVYIHNDNAIAIGHGLAAASSAHKDCALLACRVSLQAKSMTTGRRPKGGTANGVNWAESDEAEAWPATSRTMLYKAGNLHRHG